MSAHDLSHVNWAGTGLESESYGKSLFVTITKAEQCIYAIANVKRHARRLFAIFYSDVFVTTQPIWAKFVSGSVHIQGYVQAISVNN